MAIVVPPSANRALTTLRASRDAAPTSSAAPHEEQKRALSATGCPQDEQKAMTKHRTRDHGISLAVTHAPKFAAIIGGQR